MASGPVGLGGYLGSLGIFLRQYYDSLIPYAAWTLLNFGFALCLLVLSLRAQIAPHACALYESVWISGLAHHVLRHCPFRAGICDVLPQPRQGRSFHQLGWAMFCEHGHVNVCPAAQDFSGFVPCLKSSSSHIALCSETV